MIQTRQKGVLMSKQWNVPDCQSQSPDLNPTNHVFPLQKTRPKTKIPRKNNQEMKIAAVQS